jgi:hypothetical protein
MSATEAAWLAGFIDGEGTISSCMAGRDRKYKTWLISVPNTHFGSLDRCVEITGAGYVLKKTEGRDERRKPQNQWRVTAQRDIYEICRQIRPYCVIKGEQIDAFINEWVDIKVAA